MIVDNCWDIGGIVTANIISGSVSKLRMPQNGNFSRENHEPFASIWPI
jgi:hypothetical protein